MLKKLTGLFFVVALAFTATAADIVVRIAPPRNIRENRPPSPGRNHQWTSGYQRWDGNAYGWTPGRWEQRPRPNARWQAHRWNHQKQGWVFVEGHWR